MSWGFVLRVTVTTCWLFRICAYFSEFVLTFQNLYWLFRICTDFSFLMRVTICWLSRISTNHLLTFQNFYLSLACRPWPPCDMRLWQPFSKVSVLGMLIQSTTIKIEKRTFGEKKIWYPHPRGCSNLANILKSQILSKVSALAYFMITIVIINIINIIIIIIIIILFISQQPGKYFQKSAP